MCYAFIFNCKKFFTTFEIVIEIILMFNLMFCKLNHIPSSNSILVIFCICFLQNYSLAKNNNQILDSLKKEIYTNNVDSIILKSYILLAKKEFYSNQDSAIYHAKQGIKFAKKTNNSKDQLTLYKWLTKTYSKKGDYINLYHANEEYLNSALSYKDSLNIVNALGNKGRMFLDVGLNEYALKYNQEAIDSANKFGLKANEANHLFHRVVSF